MLPFYAASEEISAECDSDPTRLELVRLYNEVKVLLFSFHDLALYDRFISFNKRGCGIISILLSICINNLSCVGRCARQWRKTPWI